MNLGRVGRLAYFVGILFWVVFWQLEEYYFQIDSTALTLLLSLAGFIHTLSLVIRRFHDIDKSAWYALWFLVPLVNIYWSISLLVVTKGDKPNKYGKAPKKVYTNFFSELTGIQN